MLSQDCRHVLARRALIAAAMAVCGSLTLVARTNERDVYVSVFDKTGTPIIGLTQDYFAVREDGRDRAVVRANRLVPFTHDGASLRDGIGRISTRVNSVPRLLDAVDMACRD